MRKILFRPYFVNNAFESWNRNWNKEMASKPNRGISGFVHKESETKRILVSNAAGQDIPKNAGWKNLVQGHVYKGIAGIVQQFSTLQSACSMQYVSDKILCFLIKRRELHES